tara:strand:- start:1578 stop:1904 length:327 start_codon:yes stop_codon:yes gene_type:complete
VSNQDPRPKFHREARDFADEEIKGKAGFISSAKQLRLLHNLGALGKYADLVVKKSELSELADDQVRPPRFSHVSHDSHISHSLISLILSFSHVSHTSHISHHIFSRFS